MQHFPKGKRYTAIEKNLLKLRAFEMVLVLFRVQQLRGFVLETVRKTRTLVEALEAKPPSTDGMSEEETLLVLVEEGILTTEDTSKFRDLIDYRNVIAHETERIVVDLNRDFQRQYSRLPELHRHRLAALETLDRLEAKLERGFKAKYVMSVSLKPLMFEPAQETYKEEIERLRRRIGKQIAGWNQEIEEVKANISSIPASVLKQFQPGHPRHRTQSGTLSKSGVECCCGLFEAGATPLSTAYLMHISLRTAKKRLAQWQRQDSRTVQED